MHFLILLAALLFSSTARADYADTLIEKARTQNLARTQQWLNLGGYRKGLFGGWTSEAQGPYFFNAPDGQGSPEKELEATIRGFFEPALGYKNADKADIDAREKVQHPLCRFPARKIWLSQKLGIDQTKLPKPDCSRFERFKKNLAAKSATLVFSAYYINNPASAFGHTLLRLNKTSMSETGNRFELLDYGINFSATVTTSNAVLYAVYGLFGLFPGSFASIPYYYKVREYNDFESRDLWEYDLNLSQEEVDLLVAHLWELGSTYYDYYYLSANCSFFLLRALDAAKPELKLSERLPFVVIPADTVKVIAETPGLVRAVHFRPSVRVQFKKRYENLTPKQQELLKAAVKESKLPPNDLPKDEQVAVLDAAIDYVDYKKNKEIADSKSEAAQYKHALLSARARLATPSPELIVTPRDQDRPDRGHAIRRVGIDEGGSWRRGHFTRLNFRYALHDLLDPMVGYPEFSEINFLPTEIRYNHRNGSFWLENLSLIEVRSFSPVESLDKPLSWRLKVAAETVRDKTCTQCLAGGMEVGGGWTFAPLKQMQLIALGVAKVYGTPAFEPYPIRVGAGPELTLRMPFTNNFIAVVQSGLRYSAPAFENVDYYWKAEARKLVTERLSLRASFLRNRLESEVAGGILYYFGR